MRRSTSDTAATFEGCCRPTKGDRQWRFDVG
jgi:hypothetical protein